MSGRIKNILTILIIIISSTAFSTIKVDAKHVYNVENNSTISSFNGLVPEVDKFNNKYNSQSLIEFEELVLNWINTSEEGFYLQDFDQDKFHWQFI